jgi:oligoendopeptidase F
VYPEAFVGGMIADLERTMQEQKKVTQDELPIINFDVEDLYNFAYNKKQLDIWNEKVKEIKTQLDIMFKNSRSCSKEADKPEVIELKIKELQKALETCQKYRMHLLKSQAEMIKQIDVGHMRTVLELKKIIEYINIAQSKN